MLDKKPSLWNEGLVLHVKIIGAYGYRRSEDAKVLKAFSELKKIPFVWVD